MFGLLIVSNQQRELLVSSLHGDLSDSRKVKTDTLVIIEQVYAVVTNSGCGLPKVVINTNLQRVR